MNSRMQIDAATRVMLTDLAECFDSPCVVGAPRLAAEMLAGHVKVTALTDEHEFVGQPGFRHWSIAKPVYIENSFDFALLVVDEDTRPLELCGAMRVLFHFHDETPAVVVAPRSTASRHVAVLDRFGVQVRKFVGDLAIISNFELP